MKESTCGEWMARVLLASESERRREWLTSFLSEEVHHFQAKALSSEEAVAPRNLNVCEKVEFICMAKAMSASEELSLQESEGGGKFDIVIVSDTMVEDPDNHMVAMGKPKDELDATAMLLRLSGTRHRVWSSSAILRRPEEGGGSIELHSGWSADIWTNSAIVEFDDLTEQEIVDLVVSESWIGKAGGYDLAGASSRHCKLVEGDEVTVLGLSAESVDFLKLKISRQR
jgi:septum formation protein|tara:strand:- start:71 stop:754 length:684 start_codon:yes stop_codon:yes gene_type:complete